MAFKVHPDGSITVDTADELAEVLRIRRKESGITAKSRQVEMPLRPEMGPLTARDQGAERNPHAAFMSELSPEQQQFLRFLADSGHASDDDIRARLNLDSNVALRGMLISLARRAKTAQLGAVVQKQVRRVNGGKGRAYQYTLSPAFRRALGA